MRDGGSYNPTISEGYFFFLWSCKVLTFKWPITAKETDRVHSITLKGKVLILAYMLSKPHHYSAQVVPI